MKAIRYWAIMLVMGVWVGSAAGRWASPVYVPAERLIENATAYIKENPNDPSGYYTLARIHYLAFINKAFLVGTFNEGTLPRIIPYYWWENYLRSARRAEAKEIALKEFELESTSDLTEANRTQFWQRVYAIEDDLEEQGWQPEQPTEEQLVGHAAAAQWNFYKAIALDPNNALYYLGQASLGEQYLDFFEETSLALMPPQLKTILMNEVKEIYLLAYDLSIQKDLELEYLPIEGLRGIISYEAGIAFVRLWEADGQIPSDVQEKIAGIKANLATFEALRPGAITPIIFSLEENSSLAELLAPTQIVQFDMDGDGIAERRPWVKPTTGFLVWDGDGDGQVTSGRELFGSVTWWLLLPNGYRAMDVLDDDRDGFLTYGELDGISVWFDRNSNGRSDIGEIVSVESLEITAIATRPNGYDGKSPIHTFGLRLKNGRTLPTYDWIAPSVQSNQETSLP
jgi:hypothetical protein